MVGPLCAGRICHYRHHRHCRCHSHGHYRCAGSGQSGTSQLHKLSSRALNPHLVGRSIAQKETFRSMEIELRRNPAMATTALPGRRHVPLLGWNLAALPRKMEPIYTLSMDPLAVSWCQQIWLKHQTTAELANTSTAFAISHRNPSPCSWLLLYRHHTRPVLVPGFRF